MSPAKCTVWDSLKYTEPIAVLYSFSYPPSEILCSSTDNKLFNKEHGFIPSFTYCNVLGRNATGPSLININIKSPWWHQSLLSPTGIAFPCLSSPFSHPHKGSPTHAFLFSQTSARCPHPRQRKAPLLYLQDPKYYHHLIAVILQANFLATAPLWLNRLNAFPERKMLPLETIFEWRLIWGAATGIDRWLQGSWALKDMWGVYGGYAFPEGIDHLWEPTSISDSMSLAQTSGLHY